MVRVDNPDSVFLGPDAKYKAVIDDIKSCFERGQPVLVGTASIDVSELVSGLLKKERIPHEVLNAKQHEREAHIVAQAGAPGSVTIATNMAGRGTDIVLGGSLEALLATLPETATDADRQKTREEWKKRHDQVLASGGLHIVGTERHESRRIDNQLRGRSGRQGDPGSSRFYLSLQDNLMRIFGGERIGRWMQMFGMKEDEALEDRLITRQIEKVQRKVEQHNFDIRKNLLEFDDVANDQRKVIYAQRDELLEIDDISDMIVDIRQDVVVALVRKYVPADSIDDQWDIAGLDRELASELNLRIELPQWIEGQKDVDAEAILEHVRASVEALFAEKEVQVGPETMRSLEKHVMLSVVDNAWKEHLASMDYLRQGIYLRGYAQKQPKQEFKRESFELFGEMLDRIKSEVVQMLARIRIRSEDEVTAMEAEQQRAAEGQRLQFQHADAQQLGVGSDNAVAEPVIAPVLNDGPKVGRNDPCPCGSGKKYKHCHGQLS
jgi:preprotein translocase subunit SecA